MTLPKRFIVVNDYNVCESSFSSESLTTSSQMTESIKKSVGVKGEVSIPISSITLDFGAGVGAGSYSMSAANAMKRDMTVSSTAQCETKIFRMIDYSSYPDLDNGLTSWLNKHFVSGSPDDYFALFKEFGTHIARQLTIGAEFGATTVVTELQKSMITQSGENLETTLSVGIPFIFSVDKKNVSEESRKAKESMDEAGVIATTWSIGGSTVSNADAFYLGATTNPTPLKYEELESLCEVLETKDINNFDMDNCFKAFIPYCERVMAGTGYNCKVMLGEPNEGFECVFDEHCSEPGAVCAGGICLPVGFEVVPSNRRISYYADPNKTKALFKYEKGMIESKLLLYPKRNNHLKFCYRGEAVLRGCFVYKPEFDSIYMTYQFDEKWDETIWTNSDDLDSTHVINKVALEPRKYFFVVRRGQSCVGKGYKD